MPNQVLNLIQDLRISASQELWDLEDFIEHVKADD
jgi:hypothetical protein